MILCIKKDAIPITNEVTLKGINLQEVLTKEVAYYPSEEKALTEGYVPIDFSTGIRTTYSNKVIEMPSKECKDEVRYFVNLTHVLDLPYRGYDLIMYLSSVALTSLLDDKVNVSNVNNIMMHSQFNLIGLYNPSPTIINPIVVSNIVFNDDDTLDNLFWLFKTGNSIVNITDIKEQGNVKALLDTYKICRNRR